MVEGDTLVPGTVLTVTLTADHRAVDGAMAAEFLRTLKRLLEEPAIDAALIAARPVQALRTTLDSTATSAQLTSRKDIMAYDYDIVVIGGGPAGYAGAIRAAQLKKRVLCVERDKLGGICLNWGCIPTKALLTNAHLVELIKNHGKRFGYNGQGDWDFGQMIGRSRSVAGQLNKGIEGLFRKYKVASKFGVAKVVGPHEVQVGDEKVTAESIVIATGVRPRPLPGAEFDGKTIISYKEAMSLAKQPEVDADHRRRADRPGVRLLLQRDRHQGHRRRDARPDPPRRGRGGLRRAQEEPVREGAEHPHQLEDDEGREDRQGGQGRDRDARRARRPSRPT